VPEQLPVVDDEQACVIVWALGVHWHSATEHLFVVQGLKKGDETGK